MIVVIDYGAGNLKSVTKALDFLMVKHIVTTSQSDIAMADKIIFPGVGNFGEVMKQLKKLKLITALKREISDGKPYLGICIGLQVLFESSEEEPSTNGLGILNGKVLRLKTKFKIPHIGWNSIKIEKKSKLLSGIKDSSYLYFVHSYCVLPEDKNIILTTTDYGSDFVSGIAKENIYGLQFHPEKSGMIGLRILENFVGI